MDSKSLITLNQICQFISKQLKLDNVHTCNNWGSINDVLKQHFLIKAKRSEKETFDIILVNKTTECQSEWFQLENFQNLLISQELEEIVLYIDFYNEYTILEPIFEKKIFKCQNKLCGSVFAAKFFSQQGVLSEKLKQNQFLQLNQVLNQTPHRNVLNLKKIYHHNHQFIGITDYLEGGNLYQIFQHHHFKFSLTQIKAILRGILLALNHIHNKGIMHRDIKLSNIVFRDKLDLKSLKVIDFEFATFLNNPEYSDCGTEGYIAPEVRLMQNYDERCDIYSAGIIFYILVFQQRPRSSSEIQIDISKIKYQVEDIEDYELALDLMKNMLQYNYLKRLTSQQCLDHDFFYQVDYVGPNKINSLTQLNFKNPFHQFKSFPTS